MDIRDLTHIPTSVNQPPGCRLSTHTTHVDDFLLELWCEALAPGLFSKASGHKVLVDGLPNHELPGSLGIRYDALEEPDVLAFGKQHIIFVGILCFSELWSLLCGDSVSCSFWNQHVAQGIVPLRCLPYVRVSMGAVSECTEAQDLRETGTVRFQERRGI